MYIVNMGTVIQYRGIRFMIRTSDHSPAHVHAVKADREAKVYILTGEAYWSTGFSRNDLKLIEAHVRKNRQLLLEAWNEIHQED